MAWGPWEPLGIGAEHQIRFGEERQIDGDHQIGAEHQIGLGGNGGVQHINAAESVVDNEAI